MKRRFANGILITLLAALILDFASLAGAEEEWLRFDGTYAAVYDCDGIVICTSSVHRTGYSGIDDRFEAIRENGLITEATVLSRDINGWSGLSKFVFEYTEEEMPASRYATMINSFLMGEENNWYKFFWY